VGHPPLIELVHPSWLPALAPVAEELAALDRFLDAQGEPWLPERQNVMRAFTYPFEAVRVLIVGQDPYPSPGHPIGLSFAVERHVRPLPRSLQNIYRELGDDIGVELPQHGDLTAWAENGVMLLNRVLTVQTGLSGSHRGKGWEQVTESAIRALATRDTPLVAVLWGNDAQKLRPTLGAIPVVASAHPSPLSARRGFFGSMPFSRVNEALISLGADPVDWRLA
jgi:uracil-DNA glycosylase